MPRISIVMPAYNVERYIAESIESVLLQTYTDYELLVIDDGSTDRTLQVAERYAAAHPGRIRVLSQANRGPGAARNVAFRAAQGAIFALLDSDDTWAPGFLAEQLRILDAERDTDIITANAFILGGPREGQTAQPFPDARPAPDLLQILADETAVFVMTVFARAVVDTIGGFDETLRTNEDYDFWIRAARAGFRFRRNPRPLGWYRRHGRNLSADDVRMLNGIIRVYRRALDASDPGSQAAAIITQQIWRFETERIAAEARAALEAADVPTAADLVDALRVRRGGWPLRALSLALHYVPRTALWACRTRRQMQSWGG